MQASDVWQAFSRYEAEINKASNPQEQEAATKRVINTVNSIYGPNAAMMVEIQRAKRSFYSFFGDDLENLENALKSANDRWQEQQTSILHSFRVARERSIR